MSEYMNNIGIGDLCQHRLSMLAYMFNVAKGDLCQHMLSKSPYIDGMGDLCQHRLSTLEFINNICIKICLFVYNCLVCFKTTPSANDYQDFVNFPTGDKIFKFDTFYLSSIKERTLNPSTSSSVCMLGEDHTQSSSFVQRFKVPSRSLGWLIRWCEENHHQ